MEIKTHRSNISEDTSAFESRKADHLRLSLDPRNQAQGLTGMDRIQLTHDALPEIDFADVRLNSQILGSEWSTPFLVSSMTLGNREGQKLNSEIADALKETGWGMGVGSQRRQLFDSQAQVECRELRRKLPRNFLAANLGLTQLIRISDDEVRALVDSLESQAFFVHLNPLQECLQEEGTPVFRGGLARITGLVRALEIPVIVKETGCGFSIGTLQKLKDTGIAAVDVSGLGGTHWGRVETDRAPHASVRSQSREAFLNWGVSTLDSLEAALGTSSDWEVWASGGIRNGVEAAKAVAMGARAVGFAQPILQAAQQGADSIVRFMRQTEFELKTALFCTGSQNLESLRESGKWQKK